MLLALATMAFLSACAPAPVNSFCLIDAELNFSDATLMSMDAIDRRMLYQHNCKYIKICYLDEYEKVCGPDIDQ